MKKKLGNNLGLKILSFVIAILVWLFVVNVNNPIGTKSFVISDVQLLNEAYIDADGKMCIPVSCSMNGLYEYRWMIFGQWQIFSRRSA